MWPPRPPHHQGTAPTARNRAVPFHDQLIQRTATRLQRACGPRALNEARGWCRYFAAENKQPERRMWARVSLELRNRERDIADAA